MKNLDRKGKSVFILNTDLPIVHKALTEHLEKLQVKKDRREQEVNHWRVTTKMSKPKGLKMEHWEEAMKEYMPHDVRQKRSELAKLDEQIKLTEFLCKRFATLILKARV